MSRIEEFNALQQECLAALLRPIIRFCVRRSRSFQDYLDVSKRIFVEVAEDEMRRSTAKVNVNRISMMTGLNRGEVTRFFRKETDLEGRILALQGRVIAQWEQDKRFLTTTGKPRTLSYEGEESEFRELVASVNRHLNPGSILFELERMGAVKKTPKGIKLERVPVLFNEDERDAFKIIGMDIGTLIDAVSENVQSVDEVKNHHQRTEYDNIYEKDLETVRDWLCKEGANFHRKVRDFLSQFDRDLVPPPTRKESKKYKAQARVTFCAFSKVTPSEDAPKD